jgi:hypothetical protein
MTDSLSRSHERYRRVVQNLRRLLEQTPSTAGTTARFTGTSEETAQLFSSGTTPAVQGMRDGAPPAPR